MKCLQGPIQFTANSKHTFGSQLSSRKNWKLRSAHLEALRPNWKMTLGVGSSPPPPDPCRPGSLPSAEGKELPYPKGGVSKSRDDSHPRGPVPKTPRMCRGLPETGTSSLPSKLDPTLSRDTATAPLYRLPSANTQIVVL